MKKKLNYTVICLLDKEWPPNHSFIDGMLAGELAKTFNIYVRLVVSRSKSVKYPIRYLNSTCVPLLFKRNGIWRFLNLFQSLKLLVYQINREKLRNKDVILFVRNDPILLLSASLLRSKVSRLIFQSSFPHENISGSFFKRFLAKVILRLSKKKVDGLLAVSPRGLIRLKKLMPSVTKAEYIPLLSDQNMKVPDFKLLDKNKTIKFVYVGDHSKLRKLDTVLKAIVLSIDRGLQAEFKFIGGETKDIMRLSQVIGVKNLLKKGSLKFVQKISRNYLLSFYSDFDVGLCLIPPDKYYIEASPTKLTEYMGAGLAVIANKEIELQEEIIENSKGGLLCSWDENSIANVLIDISINKQELMIMRERSYIYSKENLKYQNYIKVFRKLFN
jgi:glycosyltransferase involved in cell wall biosynthesis